MEQTISPDATGDTYGRQDDDENGGNGPRPARIANVLSIAGSDPSGGAGIQADLKSFAACGTYGMAALTALTAQNTRGVSGIHAVPPAFVADQIAAVFDDIRVDAVKIGMIATAGIAAAVADALAPHPGVPLVLDPVMVAKGGARLLQEDAVAVLRDRLVPMATIVTPNLPEAADLLGRPEARHRATMEDQAAALLARGARAVLLKGGHLGGAESPDLFLGPAGPAWLAASRIATASTHGTGCTLSAAMAAELGKGLAPADAARTAKRYTAGAIAAAHRLSVGGGHGPIQHFFDLWPQT